MSQCQDQTEKSVPVLLELLELFMWRRESVDNNMVVYKYLKGNEKEVGLSLFSITNY